MRWVQCVRVVRLLTECEARRENLERGRYGRGFILYVDCRDAVKEEAACFQTVLVCLEFVNNRVLKLQHGDPRQTGIVFFVALVWQFPDPGR